MESCTEMAELKSVERNMKGHEGGSSVLLSMCFLYSFWKEGKKILLRLLLEHFR